MKNKLDDIERGLDELKRLLIDINSDDTTMDIQIVKRRYVEAAKPSFNDDDDDANLWDTDDEDEIDENSKLPNDNQIAEESSSSTRYPTSPEIIVLSPPPTSPVPVPSCSASSTTIIKKAPLKFIIKRLQQPTASTKVKYKLHTVTTSPQLIT